MPMFFFLPDLVHGGKEAMGKMDQTAASDGSGTAGPNLGLPAGAYQPPCVIAPVGLFLLRGDGAGRFQFVFLAASQGVRCGRVRCLFGPLCYQISANA